MQRTFARVYMLLGALMLAVILPRITSVTATNLSELSRLIDTSDAIEKHLETACVNALENNVDYSAKANGIVMLKSNQTVASDIQAEMTRVLQSYVDNGNFIGTPSVTVGSVGIGGQNYTDGEGRNSNFSSVGSVDVDGVGYTGTFPSVQATITYRFSSILKGQTRPSITHTVGAELNHANILQKDWN